MWKFGSGNLRSQVGVAEIVTGIWKGLETYQSWFMGVTGCNRGEVTNQMGRQRQIDEFAQSPRGHSKHGEINNAQS